MKATISRNELLAALLFASKDEDRYTLNSVHIELREGKAPVIVTTDGRRICAIETEAQQDELPHKSHNILLRSDFAKAICALSKALGGKNFPWITFENPAGSARLFVGLLGVECFMEFEKGALVEGDFPNWRMALPPKSKALRTPITDVGLNADLMADYAKASKLLSNSWPRLQLSLVGKEQQIEVKIVGVDSFYGLVMQCTLEEDVEYQPEFVSIVDSLPPPPKDEEKEKDGEESDDDKKTTVTLTTGDKTTGPIALGKFRKAVEKIAGKRKKD